MVGEVKWQDDGRFVFQALGGGGGLPGLDILALLLSPKLASMLNAKAHANSTVSEAIPVAHRADGSAG